MVLSARAPPPTANERKVERITHGIPEMPGFDLSSRNPPRRSF